MTDISKSSVQQKNSAGEINRDLISLNETSSGNLKLVSDTNESIESLDKQSDELYQKVQQFIVSDDLAYLEEKTSNPLAVNVENPESGKVETFYLKGKDLIDVFSSALRKR